MSQAFIKDISSHAVKAGREFNVLPSLIIAQAIHESNWGKSGLATKGKNLFGVKGKYQGQSVTMPTWEVINGVNKTVQAAFRKYPSWYESICDLMYLYTNGVSWNRSIYHKVIGEKDYVKACRAVQAAGYATDPKYADKLINVIKTYALTEFDKVPASVPKKEEDDMFKPTNKTLHDVVIERLTAWCDPKTKNGLDKSWLDKAKKGQLTNSDAVGLLFVAQQRGLK